MRILSNSFVYPLNLTLSHLGFNQWKESDINGNSDQVTADTESTYEDAQSDAEFDMNDSDNENENTLRQTLIRETTMAVIRLHSSLIALRKLPRTVSKT